MTTVRILGVDPGFAAVGLALVELPWPPAGGLPLVARVGVVRTAPSDKKKRILQADDNVARAGEILAGLRPWLFSYAPDVVAAETMSFPRNASVAHKMGIAWGVIVASIRDVRGEVPLVQESPQNVKRAVAGAKTASKTEVQLAVSDPTRAAWSAAARDAVEATPPTLHEHVFDAVAVALAVRDAEVVRAIGRARGGPQG